MKRRSLLAAAVQMDADGIRTIHRKRRPMCARALDDQAGIVVRCHKRAGYMTPQGPRCFGHAVENAEHYQARFAPSSEQPSSKFTPFPDPVGDDRDERPIIEWDFTR